MQRNSITGNVAKIMVKNAEGTWDSVQSVKGGENGTKVFVTIADHYWSKSKGEQITRFVPMQGFVPQNLTIQVGILVDAEFVINTYKKTVSPMCPWKLRTGTRIFHAAYCSRHGL